uniref:Uncharacterized protein LOC105037488 n=1 Tax=Elaeis guineensis var. tenera TaxID=51953 RepID=A0A6I9QLI9_ELAGV|nr:uncharacterized protein LOC105037488 [Elaeis guineensis]
MVDPFLHLVDDGKLQAVNTVTDLLTKVYGSKEDDNAALESLSALAIMENQSKESMVSVIVNSLEDSLRSELSAIRMQLLDDFCSDDACPLGTLFTVSPGQSTPFGSKTNSISQKVIPSAFAIDDDIFTEASDSPADYKSNLCKDTNLLSVNQLLDSVCFQLGVFHT